MQVAAREPHALACVHLPASYRLCRLSVRSSPTDPPDAPAAVRLSVSSSTSLRVDFQEPLCVNAAVVTKYKGQRSVPLRFSSEMQMATVNSASSPGVTRVFIWVFNGVVFVYLQ